MKEIKETLGYDTLILLNMLLSYRTMYEISIQFWPDSTNVFISKRDATGKEVDLSSFSCYGHEDEGMQKVFADAVQYLDRINANNKNFNPQAMNENLEI